MPPALHVNAIHHSATQLANAPTPHVHSLRYIAQTVVAVSVQLALLYPHLVHVTNYGMQSIVDVSQIQLQLAPIQPPTFSTTLLEFVLVNVETLQLLLARA